MTSRPLLAIVAVALLVRIGLVFATEYRPSSDARLYDHLGHSIALGEGYPPTWYGEPGTPHALIAPGYPHALGAVYRVAGHDWIAARIFGVALGTATVLLIVVLGWWLRDRATGLMAGAVAAVYPALVDIGATLLSEALFISLMLAVLTAAVAYRRSEGALRWALAGGVLCGLAALTRANGILLAVPAVIAVLGAAAVPRRSRLAALGLLLLGLAVAMTPWTIRNFYAFGSFVPISTQPGFLAAVTYNPAAHPGTWEMNYAIPENFSRQFRKLDEAELDAVGRRYARRFLSRHPDAVPRTMVVMSVRMLGIRRPPGVAALQDRELGLTPRREWLARVGLGLLVGVVLLAPLVTRRLPVFGPWWFWLAPLLLAVSTLMFVGSPRYRSVFEPFLVLLAAGALVDAARRTRLGRRLG